MAKKKATQEEMKQILKNFHNIPKEKQMELAAHNKMTVEELLTALQENCYKLSHLGINQKRALLREMKEMSIEELEVVEKVNHMHHNKVEELLKKEISYYCVVSKKRRALNKAWKIRKQKVLEQLIEAGVVQVENGYLQTDITVMREFTKEYEKLRKEFGL